MTESKEDTLKQQTDPLMEYGEKENEEEKVSEDEIDERRRVRAAGVTGAVVGLIAGPIGSVVLGFSAAYAAEKKEGPLGDTARSLGDFGLSAQEKLSNLVQKHHVSERSAELYAKANEYDRIHVMEKTSSLAQKGWKSTADFCQEKQVVQKGKDIIGKNVCNVLEKVVGGKDKQHQAPPTSS